MKKQTWLALVGALFFGACVYDVPVTTDHAISIDETILGAWKSVPVENEGQVQTRIFRFSETEYVVHYLEDDWDVYFRAYPIDIGGVPAVQLEVLGDEDESVATDAAERYTVAAYRLLDGKLEVRTLNSDLVSPDIKDSESLRAEFLKHKDHPQLFNEPGLFQRVED
jgi:hypothetical protein